MCRITVISGSYWTDETWRQFTMYYVHNKRVCTWHPWCPWLKIWAYGLKFWAYLHENSRSWEPWLYLSHFWLKINNCTLYEYWWWLSFLDTEEEEIFRKAEMQAKNMPLSVVRLSFRAYLLDSSGMCIRVLPPVISSPIYDSSMFIYLFL